MKRVALVSVVVILGTFAPLMVFLVGQLLGGLDGEQLQGADFTLSTQTITFVLAASFLILGITAGANRLNSGNWIPDWGWSRGHDGVWFLGAVGFGSFFAGLGVLTYIVGKPFSFEWCVPPDVSSSTFAAHWGFYLTVLLLLNSVKEETLFRVFPIHVLKTEKRTMGSVVALSALLFTAAHFIFAPFSFGSAVGLFLAGIMYGISYLYTGRFWVPVGIHTGWNGTLLLISGNWKLGGLFSFVVGGDEFKIELFEGTLYASAVILLAVVIMQVAYSRSQRASQTV